MLAASKPSTVPSNHQKTIKRSRKKKHQRGSGQKEYNDLCDCNFLECFENRLRYQLQTQPLDNVIHTNNFRDILTLPNLRRYCVLRNLELNPKDTNETLLRRIVRNVDLSNNSCICNHVDTLFDS